MSIKEIKGAGRKYFKANYWRCVIAAFLLTLLVAGLAASGSGSALNEMSKEDVQPLLSVLSAEQLKALGAALITTSVILFAISAVLKIFVFNPLKVGAYRFFNKNAGDSSTTLGVIKEGFGRYGHTLATLFLTDLFITLWTMLFIIPGLIKAYSYRLVPYIIRDNPELSAMEVIRRSRELMKGNKWRAFVLDLSFIGWILLGMITCGIVEVFWTSPYVESSRAVFYHDVSKK